MKGIFNNSSSTLVAFRGLWDKFALPCSIGAYRRAFLKGIPFVLDTMRSGITLEALVESGIAKPGSPYLFVMADDADTIEILLNHSGLESLFAVACTQSSPYSIYVLESGQPVICGLYLSVSALLASRFPLKELAEAKVVLFESLDTQLTLSEEKGCETLDDTSVEQRLNSLISPQARLFKVSDLVEREQLMRLQGKQS